jgi:signal transduction histidine kinase
MSWDELTSPPAPGPPAVDEFAALVGHELATPLAVVRGFTEVILLHQDELDEQVRRAAHGIDRNLDVAMLLLGRLRDASAADVDTFDLVTQPADLAALVRDTVADLTPVVLAEHPVHLHAPDAAVVPMDTTRVRQVLFNLLSNAAKYSPAGAPIEVTVDVGGASATVAVADHGHGVAPGDADRIFDKFTRAETTADGTGLGLFVSRAIARAHGGDVTLEPGAVEGSCFVLTLPATASASPEPPAG